MVTGAADVVDEFRVALNDAAAVFGTARSALPMVKHELGNFAAIAEMKPAELIHLSVVNQASSKLPSDAFAA
jgi:hypothetical protein